MSDKCLCSRTFFLKIQVFHLTYPNELGETDLFFKNVYRCVAKNQCLNVLGSSSTTKESMKVPTLTKEMPNTFFKKFLLVACFLQMYSENDMF